MRFNIAPNQTRIALVTFNNVATSQTTFTKDKNQTQFQTDIMALPYAGNNVMGQNIDQ